MRLPLGATADIVADRRYRLAANLGRPSWRPGPPKASRLSAYVKGDDDVATAVIFDECHEMFEHPDHGGEAGSLATRVIKKARKWGIILIFLAQSPTATSIPKDLTRNCSNGVAFAVADQVANDGLLGSGAADVARALTMNR